MRKLQCRSGACCTPDCGRRKASEGEYHFRSPTLHPLPSEPPPSGEPSGIPPCREYAHTLPVYEPLAVLTYGERGGNTKAAPRQAEPISSRTMLHPCPPSPLFPPAPVGQVRVSSDLPTQRGVLAASSPFPSTSSFATTYPNAHMCHAHSYPYPHPCPEGQHFRPRTRHTSMPCMRIHTPILSYPCPAGQCTTLETSATVGGRPRCRRLCPKAPTNSTRHPASPKHYETRHRPRPPLPGSKKCPCRARFRW